MHYKLNGKLRGLICCDREEVLAGAVVRVYRRDPDAGPASTIKEAFAVLSERQVEGKAKALIAETKTRDDGSFEIELDAEEHGYQGGPLELDARVARVEGLDPDAKKDPVQFTFAAPEPDWITDGEQSAAPDISGLIPSRFWCLVRARFDVWVICGRFLTCEGRHPLPGARVRAFDADWIQDDPLGEAMTDMAGRFHIYYTSADFCKTPFSPLLNLEFRHGPDVYFKVEFGGDLLIDESQSDGRQPGRENVPHCFCTELCTDRVKVPKPTEVPHWEFVEVFDVDSDFSAEGYAGSGSAVLNDGVDLFGNMPLKNFGNGKALKYRFLIGAWRWPGAEDPAVMPSIPPVDAELTPVASIAPTRVGVIYYTDANGDPQSAAVDITSADLDGDECFTLLGHKVTVDMKDGTTQPIPVSESNFVHYARLLKIDTRAITPPPHDVLEDLGKPFAGNAVAAAQRAPIRRYKLRFQVYDSDEVVNLSKDNKTLGAIVLDNSPVRWALHLQELVSSLCNKVTNQVHVRYTLDHPHLNSFSVIIRNNGGTVHSGPPLPAETFSGNFFFRGGQSGVGGIPVNVSADPSCAYAVVLSWHTRHYHGTRSLSRQREILYCK